MQVVKAPDVKLRIQTKPVKKITPALKQTLKEMIKLTKTFHDPEGVGLASTQVGLEEQFFVAKKVVGKEDSDEFISVINPKITWFGKKTKKYFEGCLSIPTFWGEIDRHLAIKVTYQDETGKTINASLKGVMAWIFQHEVDHLNGILFTARVMEQKGKFYKFVGRDKTGTDNFEEVTI
jgi:peptide deformylase